MEGIQVQEELQKQKASFTTDNNHKSRDEYFRKQPLTTTYLILLKYRGATMERFEVNH